MGIYYDDKCSSELKVMRLINKLKQVLDKSTMNTKKYKKGDKVKLVSDDKNYYKVSFYGQTGTVDTCTDAHVYLTNGLAWRIEDIELANKLESNQNKKQFKLLNYEQY